MQFAEVQQHQQTVKNNGHGISAGDQSVVIGSDDPSPLHRYDAFEQFNHYIVGESIHQLWIFFFMKLLMKRLLLQKYCRCKIINNELHFIFMSTIIIVLLSAHSTIDIRRLIVVFDWHSPRARYQTDPQPNDWCRINTCFIHDSFFPNHTPLRYLIVVYYKHFERRVCRQSPLISLPRKSVYCMVVWAVGPWRVLVLLLPM